MDFYHAAHVGKVVRGYVVAGYATNKAQTNGFVWALANPVQRLPPLLATEYQWLNLCREKGAVGNGDQIQFVRQRLVGKDQASTGILLIFTVGQYFGVVSILICHGLSAITGFGENSVAIAQSGLSAWSERNYCSC